MYAGKGMDPREDEPCQDRNDGGLTRLRNRAFEQNGADGTAPAVHCFQRQSLGSVPFMGAVKPALHTQAVDAPFSSCAEGLARKTKASTAAQDLHVALPEASFTCCSRDVRESESYCNERWKAQHREHKITKSHAS